MCEGPIPLGTLGGGVMLSYTCPLGGLSYTTGGRSKAFWGAVHCGPLGEE